MSSCSGTGSESSNRSSSGKGGFVPPSTDDLDAILDQYEFIELLGRGGMGAVYKARQKSLDRLVAIKILPPNLTTDEEEQGFHFAERFQREAKAMAKLSHPHIIGVHDFGRAKDGQFYFVMEYIEGTDLNALIKGGGLTTAHVTGWMSQICEALQYAHNKGIVHRDIKPANIMITREGNVKVADFGLAKLAGGDAAETKLTMTNMAMGTPDYVAPEVLEAGVEVDHRVDLYALGVMLYEMLTGKVPRGAWRPPSTQIAGLDPRFDDLIDRAMDSDRESRFQQAGEISATIFEIVNTPAGPSRPKLMMGSAAGSAKPAAAAPASGKKPPAIAVKAVEPARERPAPAPPAAKGPAPDRRVAGTASKKGPGKPVSPLLVIGGLALGAVAVGFGVYAIFKPDLPDRPDKVVVSSPAPAPPNPAPANPAPANPAPATSATGSPRLSPSTEPWVDAFSHPKLRDVTEPVGGALRFKSKAAVALTQALRDGAVRMLFSFDGDAARIHECNVIVRAPDADSVTSYRFRMQGTPSSRRFSNIGLIERGKAPRVLTNPAFEPPGKTPLPEGQPIELELRAIGTTLTGKLNGAVLGSIEDSTLSQGSMGIELAGGARLHAVETLDLSKPAPGTANPNAASEQWIDGLAEWLAVPGNTTKKTLEKEGTGWRYKGPESIGLGARLSPPYQLANVAVRLTSKGGVGSISLRDQGGAGNKYLAVLAYPNFEIRRSQNKESTTLAKFKAPAGFKGDASYVMEFRAEGEVLTLKVDGQTLGSVKDATYSTGKFNVSPLYALIEKLEYRELPLVVPAAATAASTDSKPATPSAATATKDSPFVNSLGMKFIPVPITGGPSAGEPVLFSVWVTRVQDYSTYAAANPQADASWKIQERESVPAGREPDHPVVGVNWSDAQAFCRWLTAKDSAEGRLPQGWKYRLPSDEEWSWAVGLPAEPGATPAEKSGKNKVDYPWGKGYPPKLKVGNYADESYHGKFPKTTADKTRDQPWIEGYEDGYPTTSPVGSFPANAHGLHDMGGNVWQWCEDWFDNSQKGRVVRGASWYNLDANLLSSVRRQYAPETRFMDYGFRCVLSAGSESPTASAVPATPAPPVTPTEPAPPADARLAQLEAGFKARLDSDAQRPYLAALDALNQSYVANGIARARATAQQGGALDEVTALDAEKARVEKRELLPAADLHTPPAALDELKKALPQCQVTAG